jgi:UDP-N-acetylmuramate dehydrogenase
MLYPQPVPSPSIQIQEHVLLAPYTTLGIGGPARFFCEVGTEAELAEAAAFACDRNLQLFVLGGGSNVLISDAGFDGLVIRVAIPTSKPERTDDEKVLLEVGAGEDWNDVVLYAVDRGYAGIECLAGIPGDAGGTPVQNVGAYGQEVSETIVHVRAYDLKAAAFVDLDRAACLFGYRRSLFNTEARGRYIVTAITYSLRPGGEATFRYADIKSHFAAQIAAGKQPTLREVYDAVRSVRAQKGMLAGQGGPDGKSVGSFFKNPIVPPATLNRIAAVLDLDPNTIPNWPAPDGQIKLPAAWLLDRSGFHKGLTLGGAGISSRHTLALINRGEATFAEITTLRDRIINEVQSRFQIQLEQEPVQLGT